MGGAFPGQFPPSLRAAALLQAVLSAAMLAILLSRAGLALPAWHRASRWLTWVVVAVAGISAVLNIITPSSAERAIWAPVSLALLASSLVVAFGGASISESPRSLLYRGAIFALGLTAYALGVAALVVLISIMLGALSFTGGPIGRVGLGAALAIDLAVLVVFGLQHSIMARPSFKARWTRVVPVAAERSMYVLATVLALVPLVLFWQPMPTIVWSVEASALRGVLTGLALAGWAYLLAATFAINHFHLFGLQQSYQALRNRPLTEPPFKVRWMYRFDRHPIMTGILIGSWVTPTMTVDHLLFAVGITCYVWIGVFFEERTLRHQLGRAYDEYCQRARSIVPTFRRTRPSGSGASSANEQWKSS